VLRVAGGLYLLWFAIQLWRSQPEPEAEVGDTLAAGSFWRALVVCLTNPKSVLFFGSIFAAYMGPDSPLWVHGAAIAIVVTTCIGCYATVAWLFSTPRAAGAYARAQRPLDRTAGGLMGAFGVGLLWIFE
jgi:threonine/homoserine/homoserine lactone efflux protein